MNSMSVSSHSTNYPWQGKHREEWMREGEEGRTDGPMFWQGLYDYWKLQENPMSSKESQLQIVPDGKDSQSYQILILPEYRTTVQRIVKLYHLNPEGGAIITGQPGIGKSVLLSYLLAVLLSIPDGDIPDLGTTLCSVPVVLYTSRKKILFYNGETWIPKSSPQAPNTLNLGTLPEPVDGSPPLWVLIDMDDFEGEPQGLVGLHTVFPVQAASPNPLCFAKWSYSRSACFFGLPLWQDEFIYRGWELHTQRSSIEKNVLSWLTGDASSRISLLHRDVLEQNGQLTCEDLEKAMKLLLTEEPQCIFDDLNSVFLEMDMLRWIMMVQF
ncbi:hypothetical protein BDP27DRAFT_1447857, partial [Rhodocollybia butyracea]